MKSSKLQEGEVKRLTYAGHEYVYRVDKYTILKDYWSLTVIGGPYKIRATTTCNRASIKPNLKKIILSLSRK